MPSCPLRVRNAAPLVTSQSRAVQSSLVETSVRPSGEKATALTDASWPLSVCMIAPVPLFQSFTV